MKRCKLLFLICLGLSIFFFPSCKKYPEGPAFSLLGKKARMVNEWKLMEVINQDGINLIAMYKKYDLVLRRDGSADLDMNIHFFGPPGFTAQTKGNWKFVNDKARLNLDFDLNDFDAEYFILKLENDQLRLLDLTRQQTLGFIAK